VPHHLDLAHQLPDLDELRRARRGVGLQLPPLGPRVRVVVMPDVAKQQARPRAVYDQPQVPVHPHRPEVLVTGAIQPVELHTGVCRIELEVECRRLDCLLLLARELRETGGEGIGDAEVH
jgi:hypothetical protein